MIGDRSPHQHHQRWYTGAPPVRACPFSHTGQGHSKRALGQRKAALRAPDQDGPCAALPRCGDGGHPAPEGDAVASSGERQAAPHTSSRPLVGAAEQGDREGGTLRPPCPRCLRLRGFPQLLLPGRLKGRPHVGRAVAPHRIDGCVPPFHAWSWVSRVLILWRSKRYNPLMVGFTQEARPESAIWLGRSSRKKGGVFSGRHRCSKERPCCHPHHEG